MACSLNFIFAFVTLWLNKSMIDFNLSFLCPLISSMVYIESEYFSSMIRTQVLERPRLD